MDHFNDQMIFFMSQSLVVLQDCNGVKVSGIYCILIYLLFFHLCNTFFFFFQMCFGVVLVLFFCVEVVSIQQKKGLQRSCKELYFIMYIRITDILCI